jgi:hypothetical protein
MVVVPSYIYLIRIWQAREPGEEVFDFMDCAVLGDVAGVDYDISRWERREVLVEGMGV